MSTPASPSQPDAKPTVADLLDGDALGSEVGAAVGQAVKKALCAVPAPDDDTAVMAAAIVRAMDLSLLEGSSLGLLIERAVHLGLSDTGPSKKTLPVTPDDSADLPGGEARALFVGKVGAVMCVGPGGERFKLVSGDAQYHPVMVRRVLAAGTTAKDILALY